MRKRNVWLLVAICWACIFLTACNSVELSTLQGIILAVGGIIPFIAALAEAIDPAASLAISAAVGLTTAALDAVAAALKQFQSQPNATNQQAFQAALQTAHDQLGSLLQASQVKNQTTVTRITAIVDAAIAALSAIEMAVLQRLQKAVASSGTPPASS